MKLYNEINFYVQYYYNKVVMVILVDVLNFYSLYISLNLRLDMMPDPI